jgi:tol-pal system protein YbgF
MNKTIIGWVIGGLLSGVATQVAAAPVEDDAAVKLVNRLNQLEQEVRNLRGKNQELENQVENLQQNQKDGFLQVDERVQKLEVPAKTNTSASNSPSTNTTQAKLDNAAPVTSTAEGITIPDPAVTSKEEIGVASANKISPDSSDSYYYYGSDKNTETSADKPIKPEAQPAATSLRRSDVTPSAPLIPAESNTEAQIDETAGDAYNTAYKLLLERPAQAVSAFEEFLKRYPTHPLAANAQYWLAEALFAQHDYQRSADEFLKVLKQYKSSAKAPEAALKMGYAFYELKRWELARQALDDTVEYFPNTNAARLAQARIEQMTSEGF